MNKTVSEANGRTARSQRTRATVIDALLALVREGDPKPSARQVADRAGVSTRTVFAHFATLEDLYRASVERATAMVVSLLTPIDPGRPLSERIDSLCRQRARVNEEIGPIRRAAALQAPFSPTLAQAQAYGRRASYEQLDRVFASELGRLDAPARRRRRAAIDALLTGETWDLLRATHDLSPDDARAALHESLRPLLAPPAPPGAPPPPGPAPPADPEHAARIERIEAAEHALADIDQKIDRLVTAIESGSPADLLTPRLERLRAVRLDAEHALAAARSGP